MKHQRFATALLLAALAGGPILAEQAPAPEAQIEAQINVEVEVQADDQPAPVRIHAQRIVINAPDGVDLQAGNGQIVVVREIHIDENGNAVVSDENGNVIEHGPDGIWIEGEALPQDWIDVDRDQPMPVQAEMVEATYLGVQCEPLDFESADLLLLDHGTGLNVLGVPKDSPAAAAGIEAGDVLLQLNDQVLVNTAQLAVLIRTRDAGEKVTLTVLRNGEELRIEAELGTATVPTLGPGGEPMQRGWQVQPMPEHRQGGVERVEPLPIDGIDLQEHMTEIELMIRQQQEQILRMIEQIDGGDLDLREQHERIRQQLRQRVQEQQQLAHQGNAQRQMQFGDGQHNITLKGDGEGWQSLKVSDNAGQVVYDGDYPQADEQWEQVPGEVRAKVRNMVESNPIQMRFQRIEPGVRPAPAPPQEQPEPLEQPQA